MIYAYAALKEGMPFANAAPNLTADIPALLELAAQTGAPVAGNDMKTGPDAHQDHHRARPQGAHARRATAGTRPTSSATATARCSTTRSRFKTKEESKKSALDYIFQPQLYPELYKDISHVVRINYYPPRGDNKEGWDNIDIVGWLGYPMQLKINFLCRDSHPGGADRARLGAVPRPGEARGDVGHPGVAVVLLQGADARARGLSRSTTCSSSS